MSGLIRESLVTEKFQQYEPVTDPSLREEIKYVLKARVASGQENSEPGSQFVPTTMGETWVEAAKHMDELVRIDPSRAFDLALTLINLPRDDKDKEKIYRWMRGDGPLSLAKEELKPLLLEYFQQNPDDGLELALKLYGRMNMEDFYGCSKTEAFENADCFLSVACLYLGTQLQGLDHTHARILAATAQTQLQNPRVAEVVRLYGQLPDTAWIATALEPFMPPRES